ncbi:DUF523 and DUF1722 domain-containing protein [Hahella sp. SMD15-11]|uniref:DUF523 and DUF1722 domain-containing protein n=1 Tax=Thermohahella caldifontis TaxID=3142973 RepID=A0AB39USU4_9GAMM
MKIPVGVSACVLGEEVRYDGGHKRHRFVTDELSRWFAYVPVCPEVAIGLGIPRPTIRLVEEDGQIHVRGTQDSSLDVTDKMHQFADQKLPTLTHLCGYVVCAKSPSCGMERVPVFSEGNPQGEKRGVGLWTARLMEAMPWLPVEENGRLQDIMLRENFVMRVFALHDFYQSLPEDAPADAYVRFHTRYKYTLMAASQQAAAELGRLIASVGTSAGPQFWRAYRQGFMDALKTVVTRRQHTNVLMHLQGYFKKVLPGEEKAELTRLIHAYRNGEAPLMAVLSVIRHLLVRHPQSYLADQHYLNPYPADLKLRVEL